MSGGVFLFAPMGPAQSRGDSLYAQPLGVFCAGGCFAMAGERGFVGEHDTGVLFGVGAIRHSLPVSDVIEAGFVSL